jgi:hypothetical protein
MLDVEVTIDTKRLEARIARLPPAVSRQLEEALRLRALPRIEKAAIANVRGGVLDTRTGNLARSFFRRIERVGEALVGRVGVDRAKAIYGRVQELGGVIRPKRAKHLAIPVGAALTPSGVARFTAREFMENPEAFGFRSAFTNERVTALMGVRRNKSIEPVFALKDEVTIPAAGYLRKAFTSTRDQIVADLREGVRRALRDAGMT